MTAIRRAILFSWWFIALGGDPGIGVGAVKTVIGPFDTKAQCEEVRGKIKHVDQVQCWWAVK